MSSQSSDLCKRRNKSNGGLFEHEEYCDYYWRCDSRKGQPYLQACPNGLVFAGKGRGLYEFCGYPHEYKCPDGHRYVLVKTSFDWFWLPKLCKTFFLIEFRMNFISTFFSYMAQEPVMSENCPYSYGLFPHKTSCSKYYQCWNNTANEQKCGFSLLYNEELHGCDWPEKVSGCQKHRTFATMNPFKVSP